MAGALSVQDGAKLVVLRSKAIARTLSGLGGMMSVALPVADVESRLDERLSVAAVNGPNLVVVAGEPEALDALREQLRAEGARVRRIDVDYASHSAHVELVRDDLLAELAGITPRHAEIPFLSTVTGDWLAGTELDADYWYRNLRQRVAFEPAVRELARQHSVFVEVSPHPVLTFAVSEIVGDTSVVSGTLRRDNGGLARFLTSLATLFVRGVPLDWHLAGTRVDLPTYAFQHERFWVPRKAPAADPDADWRYRVAWHPLTSVPTTALSGTWLVPTADGIADADVVEALESQGADVVRFPLDPAEDRRQVAERLAGLDVAGIVSALAFADGPSATHPVLSHGLALTVTFVQALGDAGIDAAVWCLTRSAVSTGRIDAVTNPVQAQVMGLCWTVALERPARWGGVIDLPETVDAAAARRLAGLVGGVRDEDQLAIRASGVLARRVVRAGATGRRRAWIPRDTTLITGGTGTLGKHVARWIAARGGEHVVLTNRRGTAAPGAAELVAELAELGTEATVVACDVADRDALASLLAQLKADGHTIRTVLHTAALIELRQLADTDLDGVARVIDAKVNGARNLDELLDSDELDAFVLFSSIAGMWGSGSHAAYVAGNAYLGALAEHRRSRGLPATAISWGIWADDRESGRVDPDQILRSGLRFMAPDLALAALGRAIDDDETTVAIADVDWDRYHPVFTAGRPTSLFTEVHQTVAATTRDSELASRIRGLSRAEQDRALLDLVRTQAAAVLGFASKDALPGRRAFRDAGFDSLTAVDLRTRLATATGLTLSPTIVFDHPNPAALAEFLRTRIVGGGAVDQIVTAAGAADEPIAIIGMSCRYPGGVTSPDHLWDLLVAGGDAISGFPGDRGWDTVGLYDPDPDVSGRTYSTNGGFLSDVAGFDADFFGISPREALSMDPQQRMVLETAWEAFERAGLDPTSMRGSRTGTFIGASYQDYDAAVTDGADGHAVTGTIASIMSGRVAYLMGLEGPAITLDTACSSSLVALHLACHSLRTGESSLALAGGVAVMSTPDAFVGFSRQRAMAVDGRCKAYAEGADGMSLAEGVGLLLVERLSDAQRNGHPILAVVRGSAINSDGASNGLTAPNGPAQQRVIRQALANSGLTPSEVDAVEGHGTGTALGDPIEAQALLATYGQDRERPLLLGSVKSNIGHTQMASGVAGVIKMVLAIRHGLVPRTLHIDEPSSHVDWAAGAIHLLTEHAEWPDTGAPRRAGISSFGLSGTNAHVVVEQAPATEPTGAPEPTLVPLVLSARTPDALRAQAANLATALTDQHLTDVAFSLATSRAALDHRAAVVTGDHDELLRALTALADDTPAAGLVRAKATTGPLAFLFTGQGAQRVGMGRELYGRFPAFASAFDAVLAQLDPRLREVMWGSDELHRTEFTQPALFAIEVALFRLLESWGVRPDFVAGHSIGEIAAAHVAGVLSLADAGTLVSARARLMQALPAGGAMVSLRATEDEVVPLLTDRVGIAAVNGPNSIVIAGDETEVLAIASHFEKSRRLNVSHAFHSPLMEPVLDEFRKVVSGLTFGRPEISVLAPLADPEYWVRHVRATVRFADTLAGLRELGVTNFVELGPDGVLTAMARGSDVTVVPTLRRDRDEETAVVTALAAAHAHGADVDWPAFFADTGAKRVDLPTYAFQHQRFWPETGTPSVDAWRYRSTWQPITPAGTATGRWLVVSPTDHDWLTGLGVETVRVDEIGSTPVADFDGVLSLVDGEAVVTLVQALCDAGSTVPLWLATRGAVVDVTNPATATVWGFGRAVALERPELWGGLVDLPSTMDGTAVRRLAAVLAGTENEVAIRPDGVLARRLERHPATGPVTAFRPAGTVLVTGGTGGIGARVARFLAEAGAEHLLLASRSGPDAPGAAELEAELVGLGARVTIAACDVADRDSLAALIDGVPLTGVFHAAGVVADGVVAALTPARFASVLTTKAAAAWHLHELTAGLDLDAFVLFSSTASTFGSPGQANYAAANAYLDALAEHRRGQGLPALSVAWGPWAGAGMATDDVADRVRRAGYTPMRPELAITALRQAIEHGDTVLTVADIDFGRFAEVFGVTPLVRDLTGVRRQAPAAADRRHVTGSAAGPAAHAGRRRARPRRRDRHRPGPRVPRPRLRLADQRRAAQRPGRGDRPDPPGDAHVRLPDAARPRRPSCGGTGRHRRIRRAAGPGAHR